jgi:hypothetical protein
MHKIFVTLSIIALGIVVSIFYVLTAEPTPTSTQPVTATTTPPEIEAPSTETSGISTLLGLASSGASLECTLEYESTDAGVGAVAGTYFTSGGKVRGDFIVPGLPEGSVASLIVTETALYSWTVVDGQGYGVTIDPSTWQTLQTAETAPTPQTPIPLDASLEYTCKPWTQVDGSIFEPPTEVLFKEYEAAVSTGMEYGTTYESSLNTKSMQCELCEKIAPGEGQDQCRYNFQCLTE